MAAVCRRIRCLNFETGRILPQTDEAAETDSVSPRRAAVEAERAQRCSLLRDTLLAMHPSARSHACRVLEIGSGHGHFLEAFALAHPDKFCLGIDYCAERSRRAARKQERNPHGNLRFLRAEVWEFLEALPPGFGFDAVFVLFPDPWPKRRHRKYRLVSARFLTRLAQHTVPGARLYLRTDAPGYFAEARDAVEGHPAWHLAPDEPWPFEQPTVFQAKARSFQSLVAISASPAR